VVGERFQSKATPKQLDRQPFRRSPGVAMTVGDRVAYTSNYCKMVVAIFGHLRGQVVADMRGQVVGLPEGRSPYARVQWDGLPAPHWTHRDHIESATCKRYLAWIEY